MNDDLVATRERLAIVKAYSKDDSRIPYRWFEMDVELLLARLEQAERRTADFEAMAQRHDEERNRALERVDRYESVLRSLVDAVAGEQEDPGELARALGKEAPYWIERARALLREGQSDAQ